MKNPVKPKKHLGQHFLVDQNIAHKIVNSLDYTNSEIVIEVGPGTGVLTQYLKDKDISLLLSEIDRDSIEYLVSNLGFIQEDFIGDFLRFEGESLNSKPFNVIGNFPYNISSQIFFKLLENLDQIKQCVGMVQKEVGVRICSEHGNKQYGILSVLLQAYFDTEYLFTVDEVVFNPPPKVKSAVIRLTRNSTQDLGIDHKYFVKFVKTAFGMRRKTLRNALKPLNLPTSLTEEDIFSKRAEQLSVEDFINLAKRTINC